MHLGWLEDLAYRRLIDLYCLHGKPIRNDRSYILRALRANEPEQQQAVDNVLSEFFVLRSDGWHQKKCDAEIRFRQKQSDDGARGAKVRWNNDINATPLPPHTDPNANQNQNQNQKKPIPLGFDEFWKAYPRRDAKKDAEKAWNALNPSADLLTEILVSIAAQRKSPGWVKDSGKFIPLPASWIRGERWRDEITVAAPVRKLAI
jgi:uncharacterized protein YdaU (DUF1376 family)